MTYLLQPALTTTHNTLDSSLVVFCVDTSGSMCVTSEVCILCKYMNIYYCLFVIVLVFRAISLTDSSWDGNSRENNFFPGNEIQGIRLISRGTESLYQRDTLKRVSKLLPAQYQQHCIFNYFLNNPGGQFFNFVSQFFRGPMKGD